jgi:hypothetical protein
MMYFARLLANSGQLQRLQDLAATRHDPASSADVLDEIGVIFGPASEVDLVVTQVQPKQVWHGDSVTINFSLTSHLKQPTSGVVTADLTQNLSPILSSGFIKGATIDQVAPGKTVTGSFVLKHWRVSNLKVGVHNIWLQYWVEDPDGTISVLYPGVSIDGGLLHKTYSSAAVANADIEIYPKCRPDGPDFLQISSLTATPDRVFLDDSGTMVRPNSPVTIKWSVEGGGFPAEGGHPGSIASIILSGEKSDAHVQRPAVGQVTLTHDHLQVNGITTIPYTLRVSGNCGPQERTVEIGTAPPLPKITKFSVSHDTIAAGQQIAISWEIVCCRDMEKEFSMN